jgi:hypothetical protein
MRLKSAIAIVLVWLATAAAVAGASETTAMNQLFRPSFPLSQGRNASSITTPDRPIDANRFEGARWNSGSAITWSVAKAPGREEAPFSAYMGQEYRGLIQKAFDSWSAATGLQFQEVADSGSVDIRFGWGKYDPARSGIVGHTICQAINGVMLPNGIVRMEDPAEDPLVASQRGVLTYSGTTASFSQVMIHEIGHALGLADNDDPDSIMYYEAIGSKIAPNQDDAAEIRFLYASPSQIEQVYLPEISHSQLAARQAAGTGVAAPNAGEYVRGSFKVRPSTELKSEVGASPSTASLTHLN